MLEIIVGALAAIVTLLLSKAYGDAKKIEKLTEQVVNKKDPETTIAKERATDASKTSVAQLNHYRALRDKYRKGK